jgi:hypothetical protein
MKGLHASWSAVGMLFHVVFRLLAKMERYEWSQDDHLHLASGIWDVAQGIRMATGSCEQGTQSRSKLGYPSPKSESGWNGDSGTEVEVGNVLKSESGEFPNSDLLRHEGQNHSHKNKWGFRGMK